MKKAKLKSLSIQSFVTNPGSIKGGRATEGADSCLCETHEHVVCVDSGDSEITCTE